MDDAIPPTPAGDRMRKGFQAIQSGDWKAALAWFQDAVNKDPTDLTLKRLVDLAKFTLYYRPKPPTAPPGTNKLTSKETPTRVGVVEQAKATQIAARARADSAFAEYTRKYGDRADPLARSKAVSAAARGEGFTDEELKLQLHKALLEYRRTHKGQIPADKVGVPIAVEEIILGGKG